MTTNTSSTPEPYTPELADELTAEVFGKSPLRRWLIVTASGGRHLIEPDPNTGRATVCRITDARHEPGYYLRSKLRRDQEPVGLLGIQLIGLGEPAVLLLHGVNPDPTVVTLRHTTPVVELQLLPEMTPPKTPH